MGLMFDNDTITQVKYNGSRIYNIVMDGSDVWVDPSTITFGTKHTTILTDNYYHYELSITNSSKRTLKFKERTGTNLVSIAPNATGRLSSVTSSTYHTNPITWHIMAGDCYLGPVTTSSDGKVTGIY